MAASLNTFTAALRDYCRNRVLEEKIVLAPSHRVGFQWLDAVARSGQPVFNARADTLRRIALQLAGPEMERLNLRPVSGLRLEVLVDGLVGSLLESADDADTEVYLSGLVPSPGLTRTVARAIRELRLEGVSAASISPDRFEVERKGREVREVLADFEHTLETRKLADYPMVVRLAAERLGGEASALGETVLLIPADALEDLRGLELALWNSIPASNRVVLPADAPGVAPEGEKLTDSMIMRWASSPGTAPAPRGDGTVRFSSAIGEANEVREVFRTCLEGGVPLDRVEVVYTDAETYVPHFYELSVRLLREGSDELPITFAEGIPARYSRPGRALSAWLAWASEGYPQQDFVRMLRDGLLVVPGADEKGLSFARLGAMMRTIPIGAGLQRYTDKLDAAASALRAKLESCEGRAAVSGSDGALETDEDGPAVTAGEVERMTARLEGFEMLRDLIIDIAANAPASAVDPHALLEQARYFLGGVCRSISKMDAYAKEALLERVEEFAEYLEETGAGTFDVAGRLAELAAEVRVGGQGPRPGCLHVSSIEQGGHSGRPFTFMIGLDDTRFPGAGIQDALLLDSERASLSSGLMTAARRVETRVLGFERLCARLRGQIAVSYCCRDLADDREMFPSRVLVSAFRAATGQTPAELGDGPPASFAPSSESGCIDMTEWWLWRMCSGERVEGPEMVMGANFPNLAEGFRALASRASDEFTEYDGHVPEAGADNDCRAPGARAISPSRLGTLAANPMEYFFKHILKIEQPEEFEMDPAMWLDPLEIGTLLHAVFCDFIRGLQRDGMLPPVFARDREPLLALLDTYVEQMKLEKPPPPDPTVLAVEYRALRGTAESFLQMEAEFCRSNEPIACELAVGVEPEGGGTEYDIAESVVVPMPGGKTVQIRCKLDRVDRVIGCGDDFVVCDYKTGKSKNYWKNGPFYQGRYMQAALYPVVGEAALREKHPGARIVRFEYVFPRPSESRRIPWGASELGRGMGILALLCDMIASGCFAFTSDPDDTKYSDYKPAFGDIAVSATDIKRKMENTADHSLDAYRALREFVPGGLEAER
ncbi:MAG: PD-(D/E)XK nuclease family protein [Candidatus Geothermincolia bacterium]